MSYQDKKIKRSKINKLKIKLSLVWIKFFNKIEEIWREKQMRLLGTRKVMEFLRNRSSLIRKNSPRINEWVDDYLEKCLLEGKAVNILTQWCISKDLEKRFVEQGNKFALTRKEIRLFRDELPQIIRVFSDNGFKLNWWITFNRSCLNSGRIDSQLEKKYKEMIESLIKELNKDILFLDWEKDVLGARPKPNKTITDNFQQYVPQSAFELELARHSAWAREDAGLKQTDEELLEDVKFQIACEVEEGLFLTNANSPFNFGGFILIPLEYPERYDFFTILAPDFKKRIVAALSCYPWRLK